MKKITAFLFSLVLSSQLFAVEVGGVNVPEKMGSAGNSLTLNGAGLREKLMLDLYVGGLYLKDKNQNAIEIVKANAPMAIRLHIVSSLITSDKMSNSTREGFENATDGNIAPIKDKVNSFVSTFEEKINEGDIFEMVYDPATGVKIYKNAKHAKTIKGLDFKQALFGIWLSDNPAQESLKEEMLGISG